MDAFIGEIRLLPYTPSLEISMVVICKPISMYPILLAER